MKLDDISHWGYFMIYAATTGFIIYWKPDKPFVIQRAHHNWFDEYNSCPSIEYKRTQGSLILRKDSESNLHNSDLLNLIPYELDITYTPFIDTTITAYEIE